MSSGLRWAEPLRESEFAFGWEKSLDLWLVGQRESWWVAQSDGRIVGAIKAHAFRNPHEEGRLQMWAAGGSRLYDALIDAALGQRELASRPMVIAHPGDDADALQAIARAGFAPLRTLAHMKLDLK